MNISSVWTLPLSEFTLRQFQINLVIAGSSDSNTAKIEKNKLSI